MKIFHREKINSVPEYAQALKAIRIRKRLKQEKIAKILGISHMGLSHFETGKREVKVEFLEKWANALGAEIHMTIKNIVKK